MKLIYTVLSLFLFTGGFTHAQETLILKNESEIKGKLLETKEESVRFKTRDGSVWVYKTDEIDTIIKSFSLRSIKGMYLHIEPRTIIGSQSLFSNETFSTIHLKTGYNFNPYLSAGIGVSKERYYNITYLPLYTELKYHIFNDRISPYLSGEVGYQIPISDNKGFKGGITSGIYVNVFCFLGENLAVTLGGGYRFSRLVFRGTDWWTEESYADLYHINRIELKLGILLK